MLVCLTLIALLLPAFPAHPPTPSCFPSLTRFNPPEQFAPFLLAPGLCYNNALENAASAMEVAAVAAKNCALLVQQHIQQQQQQLKQRKSRQQDDEQRKRVVATAEL